jgi:hypothetical protein
MAANRRGRRVTGRAPALIAVDGVSAAALKVAAREALASLDRRRRSGISHWDASGVFEELAIADEHAGRPSARTLLLLYAADLAFRLHWEIGPALAAGRSVVAAPYVDTAIAFGRAAGLRGGWLRNLFGFAPAPTVRRFVEPARGRAAHESGGFVEFCRDQAIAALSRLTAAELVDRTARYLRAAARRHAVKMVRVR